MKVSEAPPLAARFAGVHIVETSCAVSSGLAHGMNEGLKKSPLGAICAAEELRIHITLVYTLMCELMS